ncbi:MAG: Ig-like domain-containing protein [Eubacteriales bacterium]|nr:Ig-like domain-containing protein [Clostridiales bacterium]MDY5732288.1 Ig-like domain-containing protein [Eubacteriales bacterium]
MKQHGRASLRRCLAVLFAALMVFSVLPLTAMAEGIEGPSDNAARAAVGGDAEALAIGGEERSNAATVYYKRAQSIDTSKQYLITTTDNGTVYAMTSKYYNSSSGGLKAVSLTADSNGYIQASANTAIDNTCLWTFSTTSGGTIKNAETNTYLAAGVYSYLIYLILSDSGATFSYNSNALYSSAGGDYPYIAFSSSYKYFDFYTSESAATITLYERVVEAESVEVNPPVHAMAPNATKQLTAVVYPTNAANKNVTWTSSNDDIATVNGTGLVTANAVGTATITATTEDGGHTDTCVVTVTNNATKEVTMFVNTLHAVPNEDYLIGYTTTSGETYIMSNAVSNTSYLAAAGATLSTVGDVCDVTDTTSCITALSDGSAIPTTHQWYFGADADLGYTTIQNRATNYYLTCGSASSSSNSPLKLTTEIEATDYSKWHHAGILSSGRILFEGYNSTTDAAYSFGCNAGSYFCSLYYSSVYGVDLYVKRTVTVVDPASTEPNVTIEPAELTVLLNGGSGTLTATAVNIPESASYEWTSGSESVATVASAVGNPSTATVTPVATGKATITCTVTYNEGGAQKTLTATAVVNVVESIQVASITVPSEISLELDKGTVITPVVVTAPEGGVYETDYTIEYVCDNANVADITTANGKVFTVTAKSIGTVTVTFIAVNLRDNTQRVSGSTVITVKEADSIPAPETGEGEKPIYKKVYVLVNDLEAADGNYIIATSNSEGNADALYDDGSSSYVQRGSVTIKAADSLINAPYIECDDTKCVWGWRYQNTNSYGRWGNLYNAGTGRGLYNSVDGTGSSDYAKVNADTSTNVYSYNNYLITKAANYYPHYLGSSGNSSQPYAWRYNNATNAITWYYYKEKYIEIDTEPVNSGVEIYLDGEKISQKEKAVEGVVQGQVSTVTLTGTPVNIPAGATGTSAVWALKNTDGAINSVDGSSGVVTLAGCLGYGIIEITYTYTYGDKTYTVKNYTKLVVSSFKPMTSTGQTVTKRTIYKFVTSLTDGKNYIIVNGSSDAGTRQALKPGGDNSTLFSGTYTPPNGGTASPYTAYIVGDGEVVVNDPDSVSSVRYIETDDMHVVWRYDADDASTANYGYFTNVGTARNLTFDNELEGYTSYYMLTADDTFSNAWYYSNNKIYIPNGGYYAGIDTAKVSGGGYRLYTSATSTSLSDLQSFYIFEETEIKTVSTAEVSVDIYDGSKLVSGGVVSVNDTSSTLPLTAQTNYNGTGQTTWSIISGENIALIDQNGVVTFAANTSGKVLVQVTFTFDNNGQTATNYVTLDVRSGGQLTDTSDRDNFPEYPNEGSVRLEKTADADETEFAKTGVGTVELFVRGVPVQSKGVDVVLVVDTSGSMEDDINGNETTDTDYDSANQKIKLARSAVNSFIDAVMRVTDANGEYEENKWTNNRIALVTFSSGANVHTGIYGSANAGALVGVDSLSDLDSLKSSVNSIYASGGTNYDAAFKAAYDILADAKLQSGYDRKQYVIFLTDGAPGVYNTIDMMDAFDAVNNASGTAANSISSSWYNWVCGIAPTSSTSYLNSGYAERCSKYALSDNYYAKAIKAAVLSEFGEKKTVAQELGISQTLDADIFGISFGMSGGSKIYADIGLTSAQCTNLINRLCNKDVFAADSTEELTAAFEKIGKEVLQAGTNATVRDTIGADYDLQIKPFNYIDYIDTNPRQTDFESSIEVRKYTVDGNGNRTGAYETIEKVTFNADGTEAYSTLKTGNIMTWDGENYTITAENFTYTSSNKRFVWKFDTIISDDMAIRFNVYLTGTREGSREGGLYDTNSWANLTYTNYLGTDCRLTFEKPALPWQNARVTYKFFLVDESGRPVNKDGALVNYANLTYVGTEKTIKLGDAEFEAIPNADRRYSVELSAEDLKALQSELSAYALYDKRAAVTINTDTTGTWGGYSITKGNTLTATTAVWPKPGADAKFVDAADADGNNFTNVTVAFAVVFNVKLIPDAVVIDFGLPVDINVMQNDLVSQVNGQLYGLTPKTDAAPDFASAYTTPVASVTTVGGKLNLTYGHATIRNDTTIRYTPSSMQMNQPEVFGYEVTGTSEVDGTTKYIRSTVTVIPATTIYYEDNFSNSDGTSYITYNDGVSEWKLVGEGVSGTVVQDTDYVGGGNNYGYDSHYDNCATFSLGKAHKVTVKKEHYDSILADSTKTWPTASFRFTGTGFDVISLTNAATGMIMVQVRRTTDGEIVRSVFVDTYYSGAVEVNGNLYQIPVINIYDLPHGTYDVTITVPYLEMFDHTGIDGQPGGSYDMYIDGIRIYNPAGGNAAAHGAHTEDDEAYPYVQELRNMMITAANGGQLSGPVFVDGKAATADASVYQSDGPNNEVYLASGQSIVFALQTVGKTKPAGVYVSMKSPTGEVKVRYGSAAEVVSASTGLKYEERNMVTTSDMYYEIPENVLSWEPQADGTWKTKVAVQIANTSTPGQGQILALTNLKVTYTSAPTNGEVRFTTTQQQSQVAYTQIRALMAELYADSYDTEIRSAAFATRTIDVNKTTELNVVTSTDANVLIIRDKKGNVITPESISYEDKDGERHWKLTMTHKVSGIYIYKVSVEAAYGIMTETPATVVAYVVPRSVVRPKPSMPKPPLFGWM